MLCEGTSTYFGTYNGGAPTDKSEMIRILPSSSDSPSLRIGDAGSTAANLQVGGNIKLLNNGTSYINGGDVGIGTTSPDTILEIYETDTSTSATSGLKITNNSSTTNTIAGILFQNYDNHGAWIRSIRTGSSNGKLSFGTNSGAGIAESNISERMVIDHNGNVGIGTTSPIAKFEVTDGSSSITLQEYSSGAAIFLDGVDGDFTGGDYFHILANSNSYLGLGGYGGGTTPLNISNAGNVGIGTTNPTTKFHIDDSATLGTGLLVTGGGQGGPLAKFTRDVGSTGTITISSSGGDPQINFASSANTFALGTNGSTFEIADNSYLGTNARLSITNTGNVGIGTTSPSQKLHVEGNLELTSSFEIGSNSGSYWQRIRTEDAVASTTNAFNFETRNGSGSFIKHMVIRNDGNVGIGVTNPSYALQVGGSIVGTSKSFLIKHPTKEGKKLLHACIEGPENGVYYRGKSTSNIIEMPDYWIGLVHIDSMTVDITAIGPNQDIYVDSISDDGDVTIGSNTEFPLNYFYAIYGERKDIGKLEIEIDDPD
jgi:hypothetical protein